MNQQSIQYELDMWIMFYHHLFELGYSTQRIQEILYKALKEHEER